MPDQLYDAVFASGSRSAAEVAATFGIVDPLCVYSPGFVPSLHKLLRLDPQRVWGWEGLVAEYHKDDQEILPLAVVKVPYRPDFSGLWAVWPDEYPRGLATPWRPNSTTTPSITRLETYLTMRAISHSRVPGWSAFIAIHNNRLYVTDNVPHDAINELAARRGHHARTLIATAL